MRYLSILQSIYYLFVAKLSVNIKQNQQESLLTISPALDVTVADISIEYNSEGYGCNDVANQTSPRKSEYYANVKYAIRNSGDADFIASSGFVDYAACGTPAILGFLNLKIDGGIDDSGNPYAIKLIRFATCVIDDSNTADSDLCVPGGPSQSMGIKKGGTYGVSKTVNARFPLTTDQFNALKNSLPSTLTFTLSLNKYISYNGAAGVVSSVDGSKLKDITWQQATGQGTSSQIYPICDNNLEPNPDSTAVSGYGNDQLLERVCLTTNVQSIAENAFSNSFKEFSSITSIFIPSSVKTIGQSAFYFSNLKSATFIEDIDTIGAHAFKYASSGTDMTITFPGKVNTIEEYAFNSFSLKYLNFLGSIGNIGKNAFSFNSIAAVTFPAGQSPYTIGDGAFESNTLTSVTFLGVVGYIGESAFSTNSILTITFPAGLTFLGDESFRFNKLTSVTFLGAVDTIGDGAFENNDALKTIYYPSSWAIPKTKFPDGVSFVCLD